MARYFIRRWHLHDEVALFIGTAIVVVLAITLINGVAVPWIPGRRQPGVPAAEHHHHGSSITQPLYLEKSGSPTSLAPWDTLGYQGLDFMTTGPHALELTRLNGDTRQGADSGVRGPADRRHR